MDCLLFQRKSVNWLLAGIFICVLNSSPCGALVQAQRAAQGGSKETPTGKQDRPADSTKPSRQGAADRGNPTKTRPARPTRNPYVKRSKNAGLAAHAGSKMAAVMRGPWVPSSFGPCPRP
jgi:hypothetical protein